MLPKTKRNWSPGTIGAVFAFMVVLVLGLSVLTACSPRSAPGTVDAANLRVASSARLDAQAYAIRRCGVGLGRPLVVGIAQDKTLSAQFDPTRQLQESDLLPLIAALRCWGGEMAFTVIVATSTDNLVRLRIEMPPAAPPSPPQNDNPLVEAEDMARYQALLGRFDQEYAEWSKETDVKIQTFEQEVRPLLAAKPDSRGTDFNSVVNRLERFQNEPRPGWDAKPVRRFLLIVSDAGENAHREELRVDSAAPLLLVYGGPTPPSIRAFNPLLFEALEPAVHYITHQEDDNHGNQR